MTAVVRILLMVNLAFTMALGLGLVVLLEQGRDDVVREQRAMIPVIEALLVSGLPLDSIEQLGGSLRHVRLYHAGEIPDYHGEAPLWFADLFRHPSGVQQLALTASGGNKLVLMADDSDEIGEVWDSGLHLLWVFLAAMLVSSLAIYWGVSRGIRPLMRVNLALRSIQDGDFGTRVHPCGVLEVDQLAGYLNDMAAALQQAETDNRLLTRSLMSVQEQERAALARELHDDLGQYVTAIRTQAWMMPLQQQNPQRLQQLSEQVISGCDAVQTGFRRIVHNLYPVLLEQLGLKAALEELTSQFAHTWQLQIDLQIDISGVLQDAPAAHLYRLIQEALTNIVRHAEASQVLIRLLPEQPYLLIEVVDNGRGNADEMILCHGSGIGLRSMQERCRLLGGECSVLPSSIAETGVGIRARIPLVNILRSEQHENFAGR